MLKNKMKRKDTYLDNWRCASPKLALDIVCFIKVFTHCYFALYADKFFNANVENKHANGKLCHWKLTWITTELPFDESSVF
jgi:hypothetical protein